MMASISSPPSFPSLRKFSSISPPSPLKQLISFSSSHHPFSRHLSNSIIPCRCLPEDKNSLDSLFHQAMINVTKSFQDFVKFYRNDNNNNNFKVEAGEERKDDVEEWDWDKWMEYITKLEEQEKIVSILKVKLGEAVSREDFEEAARLKVGIAAAGANDIVGRVISQLNRAVEEERYEDAAFFRDNAGAGLVGWWAGISEGSDDPYGRIIHINAEHGRYVARSYSPRQLATAKPGAPLFEVFLTTDDKGDYNQLVVYLKGSRGKSEDSFTKSSLLSDQSSDLNPLIGLSEGQSGLSAPNTEDIENSEEEDDDSDLAEGVTGLPNMMPDVIPDVKVKLWRVTGTGKVDKGPISKVDEQVSEEDEEEDVLGDSDMVNVEAESNNDIDEILIDSAGGINDNYGNRNEIVVKIVFGGLLQKLTNHAPVKDLIRVPARIEKKGRLSFSFSIDTIPNQVDSGGKGQALPDKSANISGHRRMDHIMSDMAKFITKREKIPTKVLKDVGELIKLSLSQARNRQTLSGSTLFNRIEIPKSSDPLSGLYIGAHGIHPSEVIHLRRNFGQWQEDGASQKPPNLEFYEYVEAIKLTGDPSVPAGQVAFRAKIGKQYQMSHKGIFPEELGVVARYRGQGRLAGSGFHNPRWVDGELVIIDSKYIKGGPVVGFVYFAHFMVFYNRLRLQG